MTFASKRDTWLMLVLVTSVLAMSLGLVILLSAPLRIQLKALLVFAIMLGILLMTWTLSATDYTIHGASLLVRSGPFHWTLAIRDVVRVYETRNPQSSPALSLDRLAIVYRADGREREMLVSPKDKNAFLRALRSVNPAIA